VLNSYRKGGFQLIPARYHHLRNFLAMMPFKCGEGLFKELQAAGVVKRAETFQVANLLPVVADSPLAPAGLLAPTYRNQLAFIDLFYKGMNNTNFNMAVCGTSGAGKTGLIQPSFAACSTPAVLPGSSTWATATSPCVKTWAACISTATR
jgi:conjugal transfer ATP-binding protein TraC